MLRRRHFRLDLLSWTVILTLGLGIGLAAATGVVARTVAFDGLPIRDGERVLMLWGVDRAGSFPHLPLRPTDLPGITDRLRGVAEVAAADYNGATSWPFQPPSGSGAPLRLRGTLAGGNYFDVLGAVPALGRTLRPDDDVIGAPRVMVLSHAAWLRHFAGDPAILGRSFTAVIFGAPYTVVGVMSPGLDLPRGVEFWTAFLPTAAVDGSLERSPWAMDLLVRLSPGSTSQRVEGVLAGHYETLAAGGASQYAGARATSRTVAALVTGDVRPAFRALAVAAVVVLLVTCANVAGLLLLRASGRRRELAVRVALGAGRARLVRALALQHGAVAVAGGVVGGAVAMVAVRTFAVLAPEGLPRITELGVDWRLFAMLVLVTLVVVLVVALGPALAATRVDPASVLGATYAGVGGGRREVRVRRLLAGGQVALALAVLAAASLLGRSLGNARSLALGVEAPERLSFVEIVPSAGWDAGRIPGGDRTAQGAHWLTLQDQILARTAALPGVTAVAPVVHEAYAGTAGWDARLEAEGAAAGDSARRPYLNMEITSEDYLRVTGTALVRGRWIAATDREGAVPVIVLSEAAARALFPGEDAVGRRVTLWAGRTATVVGIVADTRFRELLVARPSFYLPHRQFDGSAPFLAIRTRGDPSRVASSVREVVRSLAPGLLVQDHGTLRARLAEPLARPRLMAAVMLGYAAVAVLLAVAGLYAVVAQGVATRRREFAVRSALGATPRALWSLVLRDGGRVALAGVAVGVPLALVGGELLSSVLFEVAPADAATIALSAGAVVVLSFLAVAPSAWRAARVGVGGRVPDVERD